VSCRPHSRRTIGAALPSPTPAAKHAPFRAALLLFEQFTLSTKVVDFGVHPSKEEFSRGGGNPCPLKLEDFLALPSDLDAHVLDFGTDVMGKASRHDQPYHRVTDTSGLKAGFIKGGQAPTNSGRRAGLAMRITVGMAYSGWFNSWQDWTR
jgi:hypothetical protein